MAKKKTGGETTKREVRASTWALIAMAGVTVLLAYAGLTSGNWRGVIVTELQVLVVGAAAWYGLRR